MIKILEIREDCTACMACYNVCPFSAIKMVEDLEGFIVPEIKEDTCNKCLSCEKVCPVINNNSKKDVFVQQAYYGWHKNDQIRMSSSSGGVFSALIGKFFEKGGLVIGAVYDPNRKKVLHKSSDDSSLVSMRKSKYVQSYIGSSFQEAKNALIKGRKVFFVGTPCQVAGIKNFYDNDKLITCDFICHGVPPMKLLEDNFKRLEMRSNDEVINFDFRPKIKSWFFDYFSIFYKKKGRKNFQWNFDGYFKGFNDNITLRKSCYRCKFSQNKHLSDITLADFWGYRRYDESIYDRKGISLVIINTSRGKQFIDSIGEEILSLTPLEWMYAEYVFSERTDDNYNRSKRDSFYRFYNKYGYKKAIKEFDLIPSIKTRIFGHLKRGIKQLIFK